MERKIYWKEVGKSLLIALPFAIAFMIFFMLATTVEYTLFTLDTNNFIANVLFLEAIIGFIVILLRYEKIYHD